MSYQEQARTGQPDPGAPAQLPSVGGERLRDNSTLGTALLITSGLLLVLELVSAVTSFAAATAVPGDLTMTTALHYGLAVPIALTTIAAWVIGSLWLARAQRNARVINPRGVRRSPAWSWLGWVVPLVSWWFPKQIVDDSWRITAGRVGSAPGSTGLWWAAWVVYFTLGSTSSRIYLRSGETYPQLETATAVAAVLAFILWVPVVRGLSWAQQRLATSGETA